MEKYLLLIIYDFDNFIKVKQDTEDVYRLIKDAMKRQDSCFEIIVESRKMMLNLNRVTFLDLVLKEVE